MISVTKSATADTRTCDFANTPKETLLASSRAHIGDVVKAMAFFIGKLTEAAGEHDYDKLTDIDWFHKDFVTGFKQTEWWDNHRKIHRHHLAQEDGVPEDVNLLDVLEYIADCVMAGMARSGSVYDLKMSPELLERAFKNTVELLKAQVVSLADSALTVRSTQSECVKFEPTPTPAEVATTAPYSAACSKCGSPDIYRRHRYKDEKWSQPIGENSKNYATRWVSYFGYYATAIRDCITHHCRCCQWKWESDCLPNVKTVATEGAGESPTKAAQPSSEE